MKNLVLTFNEQLKHALRIGEAAAFSFSGRTFHNVVIAGMGGSGIGGNLVQMALQPVLRVPVTVSKNYNIPAFANEHTLFIASSFSGNTEETLSGVQQAHDQGAAIACVTSGGNLAELAKAHQWPHILIPGESKSPRSCLGYSVVQLLFVLHRAGLINEQFKQDIQESIALLEEGEETIQKHAQFIASNVFNKLPLLYAGTRLEPVAVRSQQQFNENAKQLCHVNVFPEMNHNEIVGWVHPEAVLKQVVVVMLRSSHDHERVQKRMEICKPVFQQKAADVLEIDAQGNSFLAQAFYLIHLFDWVSLFLADLNGVDPAPVEAIDQLKEALANA